ncbi:cell wall-binding repeat-containing protein [Schaalia sp. 19OD2882]|uniref:cell wall-binding repeat-containing protein n=1 Tax=Schaalia sp. 19OD2882 TaxID=2794089 RepID=UPI001C1EE282|nr:cell wall-binding repeat-containing protein [Schaalia sp. 19OD2882]QWW20263.1 cell wall-binding repeat-containing protein [Schaalia sp. 19OD2882]
MFRRPLATTTALVALASAAITLVGAPTTDAATGLEGFDAGLLIHDSQMYGSQVASSMTDAQIQAFLESKGARCEGGADGSDCLKDARFDTATMAATKWCVGAYQAARGERASTIIGKVARACQVSPKVLLVMLQKEQSLVSTTNPTARAYEKAMGFRCPDAAPCEPQYAGFFRQVYNAASRLQQYRGQPDSFSFRNGQTVDIQYKYGTSCGSKRVTIRSAGTAALYNYTPYTPNAAALAAGGGTGDSCSSYGNRNFFRFHSLWFGRPNTALAPATQTPSAPATPNASAGGVPIVGGSLTRIFGADRYATAVAVARAAGLSTRTIHVASGESFADGLTMGALAGREKSALLLVRKDSVPTSTADYIRQNRPTTIRIAGETGAVSDEVAGELSRLAAGARIERLGGSNRYETSARIAAKHPGDTNLVLVTDGTNFPDALVAGAAAAHLEEAVLLVQHGAVHPSVAAELRRLDPWEVDVIGGTWSEADTDAMSTAANDARVKVIAGPDRYLTAARVASTFWSPGVRDLTVATGADFADAMTAAPLVAAKDAPMLLARPGCIEAGSGVDLQNSRRTVLGGSAVVPDAHATRACR